MNKKATSIVFTGDIGFDRYMDIKDDLNYYEKITGTKKIDVNIIKNSIELIKSSGIEHEFRTTIVKEYHDYNKINNLCSLVGNSKYFIHPIYP